ncbi:hypothetical protein U1Q18_019665 [Sarracenia purpurea var. burkii]
MHCRPTINALSPHCRYLEKARGSALTISLLAKRPFLGLPLPRPNPFPCPLNCRIRGLGGVVLSPSMKAVSEIASVAVYKRRCARGHQCSWIGERRHGRGRLRV